MTDWMKRAKAYFDREEQAIAKIQETRSVDPQFYAEAYCDNSDCATREVMIRFKDYDNEAVLLIRTKGHLRCPVCAEPMKLHHAKTAAAYNAEQEWHARCSVNTQLYRKQHATPSGLVAIPMRVMVDDSLPGDSK